MRTTALGLIFCLVLQPVAFADQHRWDQEAIVQPTQWFHWLIAGRRRRDAGAGIAALQESRAPNRALPDRSSLSPEPVDPPAQVIVRGFEHFPANLGDRVVPAVYAEEDIGLPGSDEIYRQNIDILLTRFEPDISGVENEVATIQDWIGKGRPVALGLEAVTVHPAEEWRQDLEHLTWIMQQRGVEEAALKARKLFLWINGPGAYLAATGARVAMFSLERRDLFDEGSALRGVITDSYARIRAFFSEHNEPLDASVAALDESLGHVLTTREPMSVEQRDIALASLRLEIRDVARQWIEFCNEFIQNADERDRASAIAVQQRLEAFPDELVIVPIGYGHARELAARVRHLGASIEAYENGVMVVPEGPSHSVGGRHLRGAA